MHKNKIIKDKTHHHHHKYIKYLNLYNQLKPHVINSLIGDQTINRIFQNLSKLIITTYPDIIANEFCFFFLLI